MSMLVAVFLRLSLMKFCGREVHGDVVTKTTIVEELKKNKVNKSLTDDTIEKAVGIFFDEITAALICGDRVELRGFASFVVRKRSGRVARNPRTNSKIEVGEKGSLYFRASKDLLRDLNKDKDQTLG